MNGMLLKDMCVKYFDYFEFWLVIVWFFGFLVYMVVMYIYMDSLILQFLIIILNSFLRIKKVECCCFV